MPRQRPHERIGAPTAIHLNGRTPAVRLAFGRIQQTGERQGAVSRVASHLGIGTESLRAWVRQTEIDGGRRPGLTAEERAGTRELERENRELRRANEIQGSAAEFTAAFFGTELDRRSTR